MKLHWRKRIVQCISTLLTVKNTIILSLQATIILNEKIATCRWQMKLQKSCIFQVIGMFCFVKKRYLLKYIIKSQNIVIRNGKVLW